MSSDFKKYERALAKARRIDSNRANGVVEKENIMGGVQRALLARQYKRASRKTLEELGLATKQVAKKKAAKPQVVKPQVVVAVSVGTNETLRKKLVKEEFARLRNRHDRLDNIKSVGCGL